MGLRIHVVVLAGLLAAVSCGRPNAAQEGEIQDPTEEPTFCLDNSDCGGGICVGGECQSGDCTDDGDCENNKFCWFENPPTPWEPGTTGACVPACGNDNDCSAGQDCIEGRCYTLLPCSPALNNIDCPPSEICDEQAHECTQPGQCAFDTDCPSGWICNSDNTCLDPNDIDLGGCDTDTDCNGIAGCQGGACECEAGQCKPKDGCTDEDDCGAGNYCAAGVCRPANVCPNGQDQCTVYSLICEGGYCVNPDPCTSSGGCPSGMQCNTSSNPPACFPTGTNECVRDDQCPAGEYCELFTGTCEPGCRDNADCAGECGSAATCSCNSNHACTSSSVGTPGDACTDDGDCPGGTVCSYNDPIAGLTCDFFPMGDCSRSCRVVCDLLMSQIIETCPSGQHCGGDDLMLAAIQQLFGAMMSSESASVCY